MADPAALSPVLALVLGGLVAAVTAYCAARCLAPGCPGHSRSLAGWHAVMGLAMIAMLVVGVDGLPAVALLAVFLSGGVWLLLNGGTRAHLRAAAASAVMVAMLAPAAFAGPAVAAPAEAAPADAMAGMPQARMAPPPLWLAVAVVLVAAAIIVAAAATGVRAREPEGRLRAVCEMVMAGTMAAMVAVAL